MDRKSILLLIVAVVVLLVWYPMMNRLYPPQPLPARTNQLATAPGVTNVPAPVARTLPSGQALPGFRPPGTAEDTLAVEVGEARYVFTSHGGGLKYIELRDYPETIDCRNPGASGPVRLNARAVTPIFALPGIDGGPDARAYALRQDADKVIAEKPLGGALFLVKEFRPASNYLVEASFRIENRSAMPELMLAHELVIGTAAPVHTNDLIQYLGLYLDSGDGADHIGETWFANRTLGCFPGTPRAEFDSGSSNTLWAATHNQFFAAIALATNDAARAGGVRARHLDLAHPEGTPAGARSLPGFQTAFSYPAVVIPPQSALVRGYQLYLGPKEFNRLRRLGDNLDVVMGFDNYFGGRFSGFFARGLLLAMNGLHGLGLSYALCIIVITLIVKTLFFPLTQASTRSMKRMAALQPQMKALQEKYKDDPQKMNQKLMEFMREHRINPAGGCLPILLQIPVFLGFYSMLQTAIELRGAGFLWACDLSASDTIFTIPGLNFPVNPLPILMAGTMLWQARLTPVAPGMDPVQQKIMKYMPLMFVVFLYSFSAGLTLYWTVQNLFTIAQMKLTKKLDDPAAAAAAPAPKPAPPKPAPGKKGRIR